MIFIITVLKELFLLFSSNEDVEDKLAKKVACCIYDICIHNHTFVKWSIYKYILLRKLIEGNKILLSTFSRERGNKYILNCTY